MWRLTERPDYTSLFFAISPFLQEQQQRSTSFRRELFIERYQFSNTFSDFIGCFPFGGVRVRRFAYVFRQLKNFGHLLARAGLYDGFVLSGIKQFPSLVFGITCHHDFRVHRLKVMVNASTVAAMNIVASRIFVRRSLHTTSKRSCNALSLVNGAVLKNAFGYRLFVGTAQGFHEK